MMAPTALGRARYCRFVHAGTAPAKPMHNKGSKETNSEGFSAHLEPSRRSATHVRRHPASWGRLCELLDRILAVVHVPLRSKGAEREPGTVGLLQGVCHHPGQENDDDLDLSPFKPKASPDPAAPPPEQVRAVSEAANFRSREPVRIPPANPASLQPRRRPPGGVGSRAPQDRPQRPVQREGLPGGHRCLLPDFRCTELGAWRNTRAGISCPGA